MSGVSFPISIHPTLPASALVFCCWQVSLLGFLSQGWAHPCLACALPQRCGGQWRERCGAAVPRGHRHFRCHLLQCEMSVAAMKCAVPIPRGHRNNDLHFFGDKMYTVNQREGGLQGRVQAVRLLPAELLCQSSNAEGFNFHPPWYQQKNSLLKHSEGSYMNARCY